MIPLNARLSGVIFTALLLVACGRDAEPSATAPAPEPVATNDTVEPVAAGEKPVAAPETTASPTAGASSISEADLGLPFYKGAEVVTSNVMTTNEFTTHMVQLKSSDSIQQMHDFYKAELGDNLTMDHVGQSGGKEQAALIKVDGDLQYSIMITAEDGASMATISRIDRGQRGG